MDFWTQRNPGGTKIFQNQGGSRGGGGGGVGGGEERGGKKIFEIFIGGKIAGDETSNRKQNFRMFSWVVQ